MLSAGTCYITGGTCSGTASSKDEEVDVALAAGLGAAAFVFLAVAMAACHMKIKTEKKYNAILLKSSPV